MYVMELMINSASTSDEFYECAHSLMCSLRRNGQIIDGEYTLSKVPEGVKAFVRVPCIDSLDEKYNNKYVNFDYDKLRDFENFAIEKILIGEEVEASRTCTCKSHTSFILFTHFLDTTTPLCCGDCLGPVPLYKILPLDGKSNYHGFLHWQSNYKACDTLQMGCTVGERFGSQQMFKLDSPLNKQGLDICNEITNLTGIPTYYYLHKATSGISMKKEKERKCPNCGGEWLLEEPYLGRFDFKCDQCKLLSNIAL